MLDLFASELCAFNAGTVSLKTCGNLTVDQISIQE